MWQVFWLQEALDELTLLWVNSDSRVRQAITRASNTLEQELRTDPISCSESREAEERIIFVYPLGAHIEIDEQQRTVWILHVWRFRRRGEQ